MGLYKACNVSLEPNLEYLGMEIYPLMDPNGMRWLNLYLPTIYALFISGGRYLLPLFGVQFSNGDNFIFLHWDEDEGTSRSVAVDFFSTFEDTNGDLQIVDTMFVENVSTSKPFTMRNDVTARASIWDTHRCNYFSQLLRKHLPALLPYLPYAAHYRNLGRRL